MSQLGRHQQALEHSQKALILLHQELLSPTEAEEQNKQPPSSDRIAVLAIAYHNTGVEQEFLKRFEDSVINYRKGVEVAERYLGAAHPIVATLKSSLAAAKKVAQNAATKVAAVAELKRTSSPTKKTLAKSSSDFKQSSPYANL